MHYWHVFFFIISLFHQNIKLDFLKFFCEQSGEEDIETELEVKFWACAWLTRWSKINHNFSNCILIISQNAVMVHGFFL